MQPSEEIIFVWFIPPKNRNDIDVPKTAVAALFAVVIIACLFESCVSVPISPGIVLFLQH